MSLHNDINYLTDTIKNNQIKLNQEQKENEKAKNKLYQYKIELLEDLKTEIYQAYKQKEDLNEFLTKYIIIDRLLHNSIILINKDYTRAFLIDNYEKEAKKILAQERQKQKEEEKRAQEEAKRQEALKKAIVQRQQQERYNRILILKSISQALMGLAFILSAPFILLIYFIIGIVKATK